MAIGEDEDVWGYALHEASWGGQRLDVVSFNDDAGRALSVHTYPHKTGGDAEDMGGEPLVSSWQCLFFERAPHPGEAYVDHIERFRRVEFLKSQGRAHTLVHPIRGPINARIRGWRVSGSGDARGSLSVEIEFVEDTTTPSLFEAAAGAPILSGVEEVVVAAASVETALADYNEATGSDLSTTVGDTSIAAAESWEDDEDITYRDVNLQLVSTTNEIDAEMDRLEVATDVERYEILTSLNALRYALTKAARIFSERTPQVIEIHVKSNLPIDVIAARTYGAASAEERVDELLGMNDIANPARVEAGTVLRGRSPYANQRRARSPL